MGKEQGQAVVTAWLAFSGCVHLSTPVLPQASQCRVLVSTWELTKAHILAKKCLYACLNQLKTSHNNAVKEERNADSFIFLPLYVGLGERGGVQRKEK